MSDLLIRGCTRIGRVPRLSPDRRPSRVLAHKEQDRSAPSLENYNILLIYALLRVYKPRLPYGGSWVGMPDSDFMSQKELSRMLGLRQPQFLFRHHRHMLEVVEAADVLRTDPGGGPLTLVERRVRGRVAHDRLDPPQDGRVPQLGPQG